MKTYSPRGNKELTNWDEVHVQMCSIRRKRSFLLYAESEIKDFNLRMAFTVGGTSPYPMHDILISSDSWRSHNIWLNYRSLGDLNDISEKYF